jgi:hypothetical protein
MGLDLGGGVPVEVFATKIATTSLGKALIRVNSVCGFRFGRSGLSTATTPGALIGALHALPGMISVTRYWPTLTPSGLS